MTTNPRPATPGYRHHLDIWFTTTPKGRRMAWYFSTLAFRAFRLPLAEAEAWIAQGLATETTKPEWVGR